jgi:lysophospholipase L1-like esterase
MRSLGIAAAIAVMAAAGPSMAGSWIGAWGASPEPVRIGGPPGPFGPTPSYQDVTLVQSVRVSAGGTQVRVRFTNEYGIKHLTIGGAHVLAGGVEQPLSFGGKPGAVVAPGAPLLSDPVDLPVTAGTDLKISLYLPEDSGPCTCHGVALSTGAILPHEALALSAAPPADARPLLARAFISGVEVMSPGPAKTIITLGDSITDGVGSMDGANRRWPDLLAQRLTARDRGKVQWGVVNQGISGNRLNADGAGQSAQTRFDRDVLSTPGAAYLVIFEGVNDLGMGHMVPPADDSPLAAIFKSLPKGPSGAQDLIATYRSLIDRAHAHGLKVYGATIAPYEGASYWTPEGEADRQRINAWIRASGAFDGVLDFDAAWRDPAKPTQIKDGWHAGDHLHGSDAGYQVLADSINLGLFK